ncbi:MAG: 50S ribosomal protein L22 [Oscillospiraceae bacterium]
MAPRKVEIVLNLIRGKSLDVALATVRHTPKAASEYLEKLLKSAAANAENNHNMDKNSLFVSECFVCPGPIMKRVMPRARGSAARILKRTSHVTLVLKEKE